MKSRLSAQQRTKSLASKSRGRRGRSRRGINYAIYTGLFVVLVVLAATGYNMPKEDANVSSFANQAIASASSTTLAVVTPIEAQSANLAASVAAETNLSASDSVANKSVSLSASVAMEQPDATSASKPQIADPTAAPEPIIAYVAQEGDTASAIAAKFGVSDQTVRWANNLSGDAVAAGSTLTVPVIDGVVYEVKDGDNLSAIAAKYQSDVDSAVAINNLDGVSAAAGTKILLPDGVLPDTERPGYRAPVVARTTYSTGSTGRSNSGPSGTWPRPGNNSGTYSYGYCTWYAYNRRLDLGLPVDNMWGNASTWASRAANGQGREGRRYVVNNTPSVGAIMQTAGGWGGAGHVAIVEAIYPDGSILISEANFAGWNRVTSRTISNPSAYNYIH
ncbi:LysM peptidoglycan-binding domain-containing protein [Candidatus Saccharibacteria bacterium]|nr:LysM peptidoglycan-binding domain-containing protein [Candidatus Saccharibacteria bacterium]